MFSAIIQAEELNLNLLVLTGLVSSICCRSSLHVRCSLPELDADLVKITEKLFTDFSRLCILPSDVSKR